MLHKRASEGKMPLEARLFSVCGWLCGQRQKPEFKSSRIVAKAKENIRFSSEKRMFCGADRQIRTADLILTKDALYRLSYISISAPKGLPQPGGWNLNGDAEGT